MKKISFLLLLTVGFILNSCSQSDWDTPECAPMRSSENIIIDESTASEIALAAVLSSNSTRSDVGQPEITYVLRSERTRAANEEDTIAYVFNYPDNGGFAIVATSTEFDPLIAYSDQGHLNSEDPIIRSMVIEPLTLMHDQTRENIGQNSAPSSNFSLTPSLKYEITEELAPQILIRINQEEEPWVNRIQAETGKKCPVGCVPLAMTYIMTHCRTAQVINDRNFEFDKIVKSIAINQGVPGLGLSPYSYSYATSEMSDLLWLVGLEIHAFQALNSNQKWVTSAYSSDARKAFEEWGYEVPSSLLKIDDSKTIKEYLKNNYLIYVDGTWTYDFKDYGGHAWVIDGYQERFYSSLSPITTQSKQIYFHHKWGELEENDGYFNSFVLSVNGAHVETKNYIPVKIEK